MLKAEKEKRDRLCDVLTAISDRSSFTREEVVKNCTIAKATSVSNVLKQLCADQVLGVMQVQEGGEQSSEGTTYVWLDQQAFEPERWIDQQISGGNQITASPKEERPRERLLELGVGSLKNGELLAILIRSGIKNESAVQAGARIAAHFEHSLERLTEQSQVEMKAISKAVNVVAYCQIMAGIELGRRVAEARLANAPKMKINSTEAAIQFCLRHFARLAQDAKQEEFHIVTLDTKLHPIHSHQITVGTLDASLVHPREVFRAAIRDAASSILLVHNHPSGDPTPSRQDHQVTERLKRSGELLGISVIDHVIVAGTTALSLAEHGEII